MSCRAYLILILAVLPCTWLYPDDSGAFEPMFNGKDLTGWVLVNTPPRTWSWQDGMLICTGKPIGEIRTTKMYQNFVMEIEWRHMKPRGNAGIFVWADDITARGQPFHRGVEVQVLENAYGNSRGHTTHGDIFPIHGAKMTPINGRGGSRAFPTEERSKPSPEWNHYRIECNDGEISLAVNGKVVTRGKNASPSKGYICLESEGGIVHYRNARIRELPNTPIDLKNVAIANRGYRSLYSGLDLKGWIVAADSAKSWQVRDWTLGFDGKIGPEHSRLRSAEKFGELGFIFDVKLKTPKSSLTFQLPGESATLTVSHDNDRAAASLEKQGRWNRIEGVVDDGAVKLTINGHDVPNNITSSGEGPISFVADGPVDLANIYVRDPSAK